MLFFTLMVAAQWLIPGKTIWDHEQVLRQGEQFKFLTLPVDPNDPFRGKYVTLRFSRVALDSTILSSAYKYVYCTLIVDDEGFASVDEVLLEVPPDNQAYFKTEISNRKAIFLSRRNTRLVYPFERFFMEEHKAPRAEERYREAIRDSSKITYALVRIKNGTTVLEDVLIDGHSIRED